MSSALSLPFLRRTRERQLSLAEAPSTIHWATSPLVVEIVTPDSFTGALLLSYAAPSFPAEIFAGPPSVVTLHPPSAGGAKWVFELIALVERWLDYTQLPSANVFYGGRSYLIRPSAAAAGEPLL